MDCIRGALQFTEKATLTISQVHDHGLFGIRINPDHVLRADQLAFAAAVASLMIYPTDSHATSRLYEYRQNGC